MAYISFQQVVKRYQMGEVTITAADHITFEVDKGEFVIIVGPSGAGKTTVLNILGGMDSCDEGTITVDGSLISGYSSRQLTTYRRYDIGFAGSHRPGPGEKPQAAAVRRAHRRAGLYHRKVHPEAASGYLPPAGHDCGRYYP